MKKLNLLIIIILIASLGLGCARTDTPPPAPSDLQKITIATGTTAGTYYPIGSGLSAIITKHVEGAEASAKLTGGSVTNLELLDQGSAELILAASNTAYAAYTGEPPFESNPVDLITGIASLYPEVFQLVVLDSSGLNSVNQLSGKRIAIGAPGSGTERTAPLLLAAHGIHPDSVEMVSLTFSEAIDALAASEIDCAIVGSGIPTSAVVDASATLDINLLQCDKEALETLISDNIYFHKVIIPEGTYYGVNHDVLSIASQALFITHKDLDADLVYDITKALFEHSQEIAAVHAQGLEITLDTALDGMSVPLHPGAQKYYKESGILD